MPATRVRLLGPFEIVCDAVPSAALDSQKAIALLAFLARKTHPISRAHLADLLWSETSASRGRRNLTRELGRLIECLPTNIMPSHHAIAWCDDPAVWVDTAAFARLALATDEPLLARSPAYQALPALPDSSNAWFSRPPAPTIAPADLAAAVTLYRGDFLEGLDLEGCPEFETWLIQEREFWRQHVTIALDSLIGYHALRGEDAHACAYAQRWLALEPWQEEAHRYLMVLLARNGKRGAALTQFDVCRRILQVDLAVEPTDETLALYQQIRAGSIRSELSSRAR